MLLKFVILCFVLKAVVSDTPANCTYKDVIGKWQFYTGNISQQCDKEKFVPSRMVTLSYPDLAVDEFGNVGFWTLIYNQGFEVVINKNKYFGFFDFKTVNKTYTISYCNRLRPLWKHDVLIRQWSCFKAEKVKTDYIKQSATTIQDHEKQFVLNYIKFGSQKSLIDEINNNNNGWTAKDYPELHLKSINEIINMAGGKNSKTKRPKTAPITNKLKLSSKFLPDSFDWRNVGGINYVSPIRNQKTCGSCYSFASAAMLEARFKIRSNNTMQPILSPQDVVECSPYSQGCSGGFPYLIAGKFAEDFGMASEACNPYKGVDGKCSTKPQCKRYYATNYRYVGGYYGGCNEIEMQLELVTNGPVAVGFEVYNDFMSYNGGVYHHNFSHSKMFTSRIGFNPFELTNHAVLVVGYGKTVSGEKFWIVKNSWGSSWGENGFFRIRRGNDECGIESLGVSAEPIL